MTDNKESYHSHHEIHEGNCQTCYLLEAELEREKTRREKSDAELIIAKYFKSERFIKMRDECERLKKELADVLYWIEKATRGDAGGDWDDVFMARERLRDVLTANPKGGHE